VGRVVFHERHVLVRRGVEDDVGLEFDTDAQRALGVDDVVQDCLAFDLGEAARDLAIDLEESVLGCAP
jgi:hypothetical protein